jgi:hypothetical protein
MNAVAALLLAMSLVVAPATRRIEWASPTQGEAFAYGPYPQLLSGGWGSGKTFAGCLKGIYLSTEYRRNRGAIIRVVGKELRETTMATFYKVCPPSLYDRRRGGRRNDQNGTLRFADTGSEVLFLHLEDPETQGILRGLEINWFLIDQAEEDPDHMEDNFDLLLGRLGRWDVAEVPDAQLDAYRAAYGREWPYRHPEKGTPVPPPYAMLCCNPDTELHWLYRRFHPESSEHRDVYAPRGYKMFDMPSEANRFLGEKNLEFLLQHDDAFVRRNVKGLWGNPEGSLHVVDPLSLVEGSPDLLAYLQRTCRFYRTFDYGDSSPTACAWWAVDQSGNVIGVREYYLGNAVISTHRRNIAELCPPDEVYEQNLADPSIFHQMPTKQGGRWSVADEYANVTEHPRETAIFWQPADNNELGTRNRLNEYLKVDKTRVHPFTKQLGAPRLFFLKANPSYPQGCFHLIRELRAQRRVKVGTDLGKPVFSDERDPNVVDHAYDLIRYIIASRAPRATVETARNAGTFAGAQKLVKLHRRLTGVRS